MSEAEALADHPGLLTSPMVGIVYTSPEPSAAPFVTVGDQVAAGDTVFLIEAMKVFNPIKAHRVGPHRADLRRAAACRSSTASR